MRHCRGSAIWLKPSAQGATSILSLPAASMTIALPSRRSSGASGRQGGILSLGYGSGALTFLNMCRNQGVKQLTDREAEKIVNLYRRRHPHIVRNWERAGKAPAGDPNWPSAKMKALVVEREALRLPNDNRLRYCDLERGIVKGKRSVAVHARGDVTDDLRRKAGRKRLPGAGLRTYHQDCFARPGIDAELLPAHQVHDELIYVVEERHARARPQLGHRRNVEVAGMDAGPAARGRGSHRRQLWRSQMTHRPAKRGGPDTCERLRTTILIVNVSPVASSDRRSVYVLRVGKEIICRFEHDRPNGPAECLRAAADAVDAAVKAPAGGRQGKERARARKGDG